MALRLMESEPKDYQFCITPTGRELPAMNEHWSKLECLLGKPLTKVPGPKLVERIVAYRMLPRHNARFCTREVKIEPFKDYVMERLPATCYVGIRYDEADDRSGTRWEGIDDVTQDFPLVRWGWGVARVRQYLQDRGVSIPERTDCDLCFFQRIGEWWRLWRDHKDLWEEIEALETLTGHTLRSPERDSWPAALKELRAKFESGMIPNGAAQTNLPLDISDRPTMCAWCAR